MKLRNLLIPFVLLAVIPMTACTPSNSGEGGSGEGGGEVVPGDDDKNLTIVQIKNKLESKLNITFEYDKEENSYLYTEEVSGSEKDAVEKYYSKIDFLKVIGEPEEVLDSWTATLSNDDESVAVDIYTYDEDGIYLDIYIHELIEDEETSNWSDIDFKKFLPDYEGSIPEPPGATKFEYFGDDGFVYIDAYGVSAKEYAKVLERENFDIVLGEYSTYKANDKDETIDMMFGDDGDIGGIWMVIYSYQADEYEM